MMSLLMLRHCLRECGVQLCGYSFLPKRSLLVLVPACPGAIGRAVYVEEKSRGDDGVQGTTGAGAFYTRLLNCAPNPLGRATTISYELASAGPVALTVHDVSGRLVRRIETGFRSVGEHTVTWNGTDDCGRAVPAGVYFVRFSASGETGSRRVTLVR